MLFILRSYQGLRRGWNIVNHRIVTYGLQDPTENANLYIFIKNDGVNKKWHLNHII